MAMPGLLYWSFSPGSNSAGVRSREIVNGSSGGSSRFQKSPFHPESCSCGKPSSSASSRPEVCEPSWRMVMRAFRGSSFHCGMNLAAGSSSAIRPSVNAMASDRPPTIALAMDAVPCGLFVPWPGAYHSQTILSLRMTSNAVVFSSARLSLSASSLALDMPWLSGEALVQSHGETAA